MRTGSAPQWGAFRPGDSSVPYVFTGIRILWWNEVHTLTDSHGAVRFGNKLSSVFDIY